MPEPAATHAECIGLMVNNSPLSMRYEAAPDPTDSRRRHDSAVAMTEPCGRHFGDWLTLSVFNVVRHEHDASDVYSAGGDERVKN